MAQSDPRGDPDEILAQVMASEAQRLRGKLRLFLGYAAGVGKTYALLEAARQRQAEGIDVAVAYVETHGRAETEALLAGLEIVPRRQVAYRDVTLPEMDIDAVLARKPQLAVVDELAHTNAPGSRHSKRYQDVLELLAAGIDVYTTLNVQHLESLHDVVAQITGIMVRETVPDSVLDEAGEIDLIDLSPEELLQRLKEGKVYVPEQAERAIHRFFRRGNLTALREIAMRQAAKRVDQQMRVYMRNRAISGPWPAGERLLVCVSPSPLSERLVRSTRRLAAELHAEWFAVYVETPEQAHLSPAERERVARTLTLAEELGARVRTLPGNTLIEPIVAYAHKHNVTKIIVGKPLRPRWRDLWRGSVLDRLVAASGEIDVYVISGAPEESTPAHPAHPRPAERTLRAWLPYLLSVVLMALVTLISWPISTAMHPTNLVMLYLLAVVLVATRWGFGPSAVAAFAGVLFFDIFFVDPKFSFTVADTQYLVTFLGLFGVGLAVSYLQSRARAQAAAAQQREAQTASLYEFSRVLSQSGTLNEITEAIVTHLGENFGRQVVVLLPQDGRLTLWAKSAEMLTPDEDELAIAAWVWKQGQPAGRGTTTLAATAIRYLPLQTPRAVVGVLGIQPSAGAGRLVPEERQLMETFAAQAALAIERAALAEQARQAEEARTAERLQAALLGSISHDLRTPLVTITGVLSTLKDREAHLDDDARASLLDTAEGEADRLNRLVGNLLDMTRLEAGTLRLRLEPCDVADLIGSALEQMSGRLRDRQMVTHVPPELPLVLMDFVLMQQVLVNLLDNALKYSPPSAPVEIAACVAGEELEIDVADRGPGIPPDQLTRVFDKLYRLQHPQAIGGSGLGLTICKGIVEAHGGRIWAQNRPGGGALFSVALAIGEVDREVP